MGYELTDEEWTAIKATPPNEPRGVPRVNDRGVLNGTFWILRSGAPWRDLPGPYATCYNRFARRRRHRPAAPKVRILRLPIFYFWLLRARYYFFD
jgi:transposase